MLDPVSVRNPLIASVLNRNFPRSRYSNLRRPILQIAITKLGVTKELNFNQAVTDVQERLRTRVMEVDVDVHKDEDEFGYWRKKGLAKSRR